MAQSFVGEKCIPRGFSRRNITDDEVRELSLLARGARADIIEMTTQAGSGHPGGSLSSIDIFLTIWKYANLTPETVNSPSRDRVVVSHGHTSAGVYAALGRLGYFDPAEAIRSFRRQKSVFEGHADLHTPGIEWACGNLGQGLSAACGFALSSRLAGIPYRTYCVMGDGEQQKGQIAEARRFAAKNRLDNLVAIVDCNSLQAMGSVNKTMPQELADEWSTAGWNVVTADGHDFRQIYEALHAAHCNDIAPTVILTETVMGKGVSFMEGRYEYHGQPLSLDQCQAALHELASPDRPVGREAVLIPDQTSNCVEHSVKTGVPRDYKAATASRSAFGNALCDLAVANPDLPIAVFDCDLSASVKTDGFAKMRPDSFFQCGIQEHSTATIAGAASKSGVLSFFADFGVFGIDETYNQQRMNDINETSLKLVCTHCGLDVGEDGKTHHCIDYVGLAANMYGWKLIVPADANQTDRVVRYMASTPDRIMLALGRSKSPILAREDGGPLFAGEYEFDYGRADWVRTGSDGVIISMGGMVARALEARHKLRELGLDIGVMSLTCPLDLDTAAISAAARTGLVVTYEDHHIRTGIGSLVGAYLAETNANCRFMRMGVTRYGASTSPDRNYELQGLDVESIVRTIVSQK